MKRLLIGPPKKLQQLREERLSKLKALPILSSDALSSVAYGYQAALSEIAFIGVAGLWIGLPIAAVIVLLLIALILSYLQVIRAYPNGGGAYAVASDQFGPIAGLVAGAALLIDYTLTVAVSVSSGIAAITTAYPSLLPWTVPLCVLAIFGIMIMNLRGLNESASIFMWPTYLFIFSIFTLEIVGFVHLSHAGWHYAQTPPFGVIPKEISVLLILRAFASGCSALTGIEAISNATPQFREPTIRNAQKTLLWLGLLLGLMFAGTSYLTYMKGLQVNPNFTLLGMLAQSYFHTGFFFYFIQFTTFAVLILAANTSYSGFPLLAALMARDRFMPRMFELRGDRLGYSNGIIVLSILAIILIVAFNGQTDALIPLYAIGVFLSFTLAQTGLVKRWMKTKPPGWLWRSAINSFGAILSAIVTVVFAVAKFSQGAWIVLVILPLIIYFGVKVRRHYQTIADDLRINITQVKPSPHKTIVIVPIAGINRVVAGTLSYALSVSDQVIAFYVGFDDEAIERMEEKWKQWNTGIRLVTARSQYRSIVRPLMRFLNTVENWEGAPDHIVVAIPQFVTRKWWHNMLHNQTSIMLRTILLYRKDIVVTTVPYHLSD
ncbi:APC family permease [Sulfoacidibacillus thermotolerans]|uniref:APC family permease n=1 Tax=Sulfoacidibacillus thermotolerans TaxID=1765684 RepID=UPI0026C8F253